MHETKSLISCDWGTSVFRLRLLEGENLPRVSAERVSSRGIRSFAPKAAHEFRDYLAQEISRLFSPRAPEPLPVVLSGMVTSSIGWSELPYARLPFPLDGSAVLTGPDILRQPYGDHQLLFISGVRSDDDVMRGEECELIGIYSDQASRLGRNVVALLPGTHSKAALICDAKMVQFHTFLTGELFDLLCRHSILRHSVASPTSSQEPLDSYFDNGVLRGAAQGSLASLFSVRGQALLQHLNPEHCHHYLSGLLIGDELAALRKLFPAPAPLLLCARGSLQVPYARALSLLGEGGRVECAAPDTAELSASLGHWLVFSRFRRG